MTAEVIRDKNIENLGFGEHAELFRKLQAAAEKNPAKTASLIPDFYRLLAGKGTSPDMLPFFAQSFAAVSRGLSAQQTKDLISGVCKAGAVSLLQRGTQTICSQNPGCAEIMFDFLLAETDRHKTEKNFIVPAVRNMVTSLLCAEDAKLKQIFGKTALLPPAAQEVMFRSLGEIYEQKPALREILWNKIKNFKAENAADFGSLYDNLAAVAACDETKFPECLLIISSEIEDPRQDAWSLSSAYKALGIIRKSCPQKTDAVLLRGLRHRANTIKSKRLAYRLMGRTDKLTSRAAICRRVAKTEDNPYGFKAADSIPASEPAVLILGGSGTNSARSANGYLSALEKLLHKYGITGGVGMYAAVYDFGEREGSAVAFNDYLARKELLHDFHRQVTINAKPNEDTMHPYYVDDIFRKAFLSRICGEDGSRLPLDEACANMRKLTVVAHCHGAYTFLKLEEKLQQKMLELGYYAAERAAVQHELLCIAHAPYAPLGVSKSVMISFASAEDFEVSHRNNFETEIRTMAKNGEVLPSYFPGKRGEMFLAPSMGEEAEQHNFLGWDTNQKELGKDGKIILALSGNAIANGVKNSLSGGKLPPVKDIVCGNDERVRSLFDTLENNGKRMWRKMFASMTARLAEKYKNERLEHG